MSGMTESRDAVYAILDSIDTGAMTASERADFETTGQQWDAFFEATDTWTEELGAAWWLRATCTSRSSSSTTDRWPPPGRTSSRPPRSSSTRSTAGRSRSTQHADDVAQRANLVILVAGFLALLVAVLMGIAVTRSIVRPLRRCVDAIDRIAEGDLTASAEIEQGDEVGQLAAALRHHDRLPSSHRHDHG